jgi:hypothetical protein
MLVIINKILPQISPLQSARLRYGHQYQRLDVQIYAVQPTDWPAFKNYLRQYQSTDNPPSLPGRLVMDDTLRVEAAADALTEVDIDLSKEMDGKYGQFIVVVAPPKTLLMSILTGKVARLGAGIGWRMHSTITARWSFGLPPWMARC